jgi:hypothetical protein
MQGRSAFVEPSIGLFALAVISKDDRSALVTFFRRRPTFSPEE